MHLIFQESICRAPFCAQNQARGLQMVIRNEAFYQRFRSLQKQCYNCVYKMWTSAWGSGLINKERTEIILYN